MRGMASAGQSTEKARQAQDVDAIPTLAWSARPDGSAEFLNRRWLDYTGLSAEEASDWGWTAALHTEDRDRVTKLHHDAAVPQLPFCKSLSRKMLVGARGFEPRTSCAQGRRATRLRYAPT